MFGDLGKNSTNLMGVNMHESFWIGTRVGQMYLWEGPACVHHLTSRVRCEPQGETRFRQKESLCVNKGLNETQQPRREAFGVK